MRKTLLAALLPTLTFALLIIVPGPSLGPAAAARQETGTPAGAFMLETPVASLQAPPSDTPSPFATGVPTSSAPIIVQTSPSPGLDWLGFWAEALKACVGALTACIWPATVLLLVVLLREPLRTRLAALTSLRYGQFGMEFGQKVEQLAGQAAGLPRPEAAAAEAEAAPSGYADLRAAYAVGLARRAEINPRLAVLEAWTLVEAELREAATRAGLAVSAHTTAGQALRLARQSGLVAPALAAVVEGLQALRDGAAREAEFTPSVADASRYIDVCLLATAALRQAAP